MSGPVPAYYHSSIEGFRAASPIEILGFLTSAHRHVLELEQRQAWEDEIQILQESTAAVEGSLFLEFSVPRLSSRIDAVIVSGPAVFPVEFKCGQRHFLTEDYNQVWDYALDLKNFHAPSHGAPIFPILIATKASEEETSWNESHADGVRPPRRCGISGLATAVKDGLRLVNGPSLDTEAWGSGAYLPTPSIIEAAKALYAGHSVKSISRSDAGAHNLRLTSLAVEEIVERSRSKPEKSLIFVTGVPGAGKTLVGLDVATRRKAKGEGHAVYLSGNGPLVDVLQEALTRDEHRRSGKKRRKGEIRLGVEAFIQDVHLFRDEGVRTRQSQTPPPERIVIFDEAQRAWNKRQTANFMRRKKGISDFDQSEPDFLISYMDRHQDWAVIVCLVGGGQEIHDGEAGIAEWLSSARSTLSDWRIYLPSTLTDSEYGVQETLADLRSDASVKWNDDLQFEHVHAIFSQRTSVRLRESAP